MSVRWKVDECPWCGGQGLEHYGEGDVRDCPACGGDGKFYLSEHDRIADYPGGPLRGSWPGRFAELAAAEGGGGMSERTPVTWAIDAEGSGWAACDNRGDDAEWRDNQGAFDIIRLSAALTAFFAKTSAWEKPQAVYIECPVGGVTARWKHQALRPTFIMVGAFAAVFVDLGGSFRTYPEFVDYWTWHKALCAKVPIPADIRAARPKWADHDIQTVAALALRGFTCPVNWDQHQCDVRGMVEWALTRAL